MFYRLIMQDYLILLICFMTTTLLKMADAGETCTFADGDATVAVFCEDGCCDSQCCGDSSVDETAIAIAIASVIGFILLILFIILLIYCYHRSRRGKRDDEERRPRLSSARNNVHPSFPYLRNNFSQTGDNKDPHKDRILYGVGTRWNNSNPDPRPARLAPDRTDDRQTQTTETGPSMFASQRALRTNFAEPKISVPAPYWRYHKKATTESKDLYSLMERKARGERISRVSRMEDGNEVAMATLKVDDAQQVERKKSREEDKSMDKGREVWKVDKGVWKERQQQRESDRAEEEHEFRGDEIHVEEEEGDVSISRKSMNANISRD